MAGQADASYAGRVSQDGRLLADGSAVYDSEGSILGQTVFMHVQDETIALEHAAGSLAQPSAALQASYRGLALQAWLPHGNQPWSRQGAVHGVFVPLPAEYQPHNAPAIQLSISAGDGVTNITVGGGNSSSGCTSGQVLSAAGRDLHPRGAVDLVTGAIASAGDGAVGNASELASALHQARGALPPQLRRGSVTQPEEGLAQSSCLPLGSGAAMGLEALAHAARWWPAGSLQLLGHPNVTSAARQLVAARVYASLSVQGRQLVGNITLGGGDAFPSAPATESEVLAGFNAKSIALVATGVDALEAELGVAGARIASIGNATADMVLSAVTVCVDAQKAPRLFDLHARAMALLHG